MTLSCRCPVAFATVPRMTTHGNLAWPIRRAMRVHHDSEAVVDGPVRMTYAEYGPKVLGLGAGLRSLGLGDGDIVALAATNSWRHLTCWLGIPASGLVLNNLNYRLAPAELEFIVNDSGAKAIIVDDSYVELARTLKAACPTLQHLVHAGNAAPPVGFVSFDELAAHDPLPTSVTSFVGQDTLAAISYTGGTTGLPKGVMQSHGNLLANAMHGQFAVGFRYDDVYIHAAPMFSPPEMIMSLARSTM